MFDILSKPTGELYFLSSLFGAYEQMIFLFLIPLQRVMTMADMDPLQLLKTFRESETLTISRLSSACVLTRIA